MHELSNKPLITLKQAIAKTPFSRSRYYELTKAGVLPAMIKVGRCSYVASDELDAALAAIIEKRAVRVSQEAST